MQFRSRIHPSDRSYSNRNRAASRPFPDGDADAADAPKSAARLAADAAFAFDDRPVSPANAPLVIVRRRRVVPDGGAPEAAEPVSAEAADAKGPRVFRVDTPLLPDAVPAPPAGGATAIALPRVPRQRRIAADKRPGPILQVFQAPPVERAVPNPQGRALALGELAGLEPIFDSIRRAQSFIFDGDFAGDWRRLSQEADALQQQIVKLGAARRR